MKAVITGGTKGVGLELVKFMKEKNIPTIFTGRHIEEVFSVQQDLKSSTIHGMELDLTSMYSIERFLTKIKSSRIQPNILIHNAGYLSLHPYEKARNIQKLFMVNSIGPIAITQHLLPSMMQQNYGHIIFNAPPLQFDKKLKYLTPYLQSKFAQTTYMKSLAYLLKDKKISCNSCWTSFPLWTDAIKKRKIGTKEECMDPAIISKMMEEIIFNENPLTFKGNELVDKDYLTSKNIDLSQFALGQKSGISLDDLFLKKLDKL